MPRPKRNMSAPMGRPQIPIDWDWVDKQLMAGCIGTEIAAGLKISADTLYDRTFQEKGVTFTVYSKTKSEDGERLLRSVQYQNALKGNTTMQIWLGKQRLGQKEDPSSQYQKTNQLVQHLLDHIMEDKDKKVEALKEIVQPVYDGHPDYQKK